jgi:predicted dehydrogenase
MQPARIGIVGAGYWATYFYLPFLRANEKARCVGVVRRNREALRALKQEFNLEVASPNVEDLLASGCDGIVVASSHARHREHVEQALEAGCNVLVEKPMSITLTDAKAMSAAARHADRLLSVACGWNYSSLSLWASQMVASGKLERPREIVGSMSSSLVGLFTGQSGYGKVTIGAFEFEASPDTYANAAAGGGYLYGQLSHQLGLALALVQADPVEVFARLGRLSNGVDIDASVSVEFADGTLGSFSGSGRLPWGVRYPMDIELFGDGGLMRLNFGQDRAEAFFHHRGATDIYRLEAGVQAFSGRQPDEALATRDGDGLYTCEGPINMLIERCLGRNAPDRAPAELGVRVVAVLEAAASSAQLGRPVRVSEL